MNRRRRWTNSALRVESGTHVLLNMINSVSTKQAAIGDRIYLETAFPVVVGGHVVVPQGSWGHRHGNRGKASGAASKAGESCKSALTRSLFLMV